VVRPVYYLKNRIFELYQRHEVIVSICVFGLGFTLDLLTLGRIDDLFNLIQQGIYLMILGTLLVFEIKLSLGSLKLSGRGKLFWRYHNLVVHFLFGSLLSAYTIFYYTSASAITSFIFILLLAGLMLANEIPKFQGIGPIVRVTLFSICVLSYFLFFYPILMGHVGWLPFWLGLLTSASALTLIWKLNFKDSNEKNHLAKRHVLTPSILVHVFFLFGYYSSLIPPVPVALKKIGVYYGVEKRNGLYLGKYLPSKWNFWDKGSQNFRARPEDKVFILLSIFSPTRFQDQIYLRWYRQDQVKGPKLEDTIPLTILGGRDEGFRGFGSKQNFDMGQWRVKVETSDGREVGRIDLEIRPDDSTDARVFQDDIF
jgi:hypothetical protein